MRPPAVAASVTAMASSSEGRSAVAPADHAHAQPLAKRAFALAAEVVLEQRHQSVDFGRRPPPVVAGEGVERQGADAEPRGVLDGAAHGVGAGPVTEAPR